MWTNNIPYLIANILAAIFAIAAIINLSESRYIRTWFAHWEYPRQFNRVMGALQLITALFPAVPQLRIWGVVLAGFITFFWVVTLLNHRQWSCAAAGMVLMATLVPASLAIH